MLSDCSHEGSRAIKRSEESFFTKIKIKENISRTKHLGTCAKHSCKRCVDDALAATNKKYALPVMS